MDAGVDVWVLVDPADEDGEGEGLLLVAAAEFVGDGDLVAAQATQHHISHKAGKESRHVSHRAGRLSLHESKKQTRSFTTSSKKQALQSFAPCLGITLLAR